MRHFLLSCLFFIFSGTAFAQSIALVESPEIPALYPGQEASAPLSLRNQGTEAVRIGLKLTNQTVGLEQFSFCYRDQCWEAIEDITPLLLLPGKQLDHFFVKFKGGYDLGVHQLNLSFFEIDHPENKYPFTLHFDIVKAGNGSFFSRDGIQVSDAYPNPTASVATIDYQINDQQSNARIVLHSLLGNQIMELPLDFSQSSTKINTESLNNGVYFYSLYVNGKRTATKKIIVKK